MVEAKTAAFKTYEGRTVGESARAEGREAIDVMMDIAAGYHADIVVFDPDTIGCGPTYFREDVPSTNGKVGRMCSEAIGIGDVVANGVPIIRGKEHTGALREQRERELI